MLALSLMLLLLLLLKIFSPEGRQNVFVVVVVAKREDLLGMVIGMVVGMVMVAGRVVVVDTEVGLRFVLLAVRKMCCCCC